MAKTETEIRKIVANMEAMGWKVRATTDGNSYLVMPPHMTAAVTINARSAGHGRGLDNAEREIRSTNYYVLWEKWQNEQAERRPIRAVPRPPLNGTPLPSLAVDKDDVALKPAPEPVPAPMTQRPGRSPVYSGTLAAVDGVAVAERSRSNHDDVDEVLLADGRIVYQCVRTGCYDAFDKLTSTTPHMRKHGAEERHQKTANAERYSAAGKEAQRVRRERQATVADNESRAQMLTALADTLAEAVPLLRELARHRCPESAVTPEELAILQAKAAKWDQYRALFRED